MGPFPVVTVSITSNGLWLRLIRSISSRRTVLARRGDIFYMLREGDNKAGIVFCGQFVSDPYPSEDWAGSTKRRMYVDLVCMNAVEPDGKPLISIRKLQETIPTVNWEKGHSGELLSEATITMLSALLDIEQYFQFPANSQLPPS